LNPFNLIRAPFEYGQRVVSTVATVWSITHTYGVLNLRMLMHSAQLLLYATQDIQSWSEAIVLGDTSRSPLMLDPVYKHFSQVVLETNIDFASDLSNIFEVPDFCPNRM